MPVRRALIHARARARARRRIQFEAMEDRQLLASFVVIDPANAGPGTLRDAIEQANMTTELDDITFNLAAGMETITLTSGLPAIQNPVTIDAGAANPDGSRKVAVVAGAGAAADAFVIVAGSSTIRGLAIGGFTGAAILLQGSSDNRVFNNLLGLDRTGLIQLGNGVGVSILGSAGNEIGEDSLDTRNIISGNSVAGIEIVGTDSTGNTVRGSIIGLNVTGTAAIANGDGVVIRGESGTGGAPNNTIGGTTLGARNIISGNTGAAVFLRDPGTTGTVIAGNYLGINFDSTTGPANAFGVRIDRAVSNAVGGTSLAARNVISGNTINAILIDNASNNVVAGNLIGLNPAGNTAFPNGGALSPAVLIQNNSVGNRIGGLSSGELNAISGNFGDGIALQGGATSDLFPRATVIQGNRIGLDAAGTNAVANGGSGIRITRATDTTIGGTTAAARNVISGNALHGIHLTDAATVRTFIQSNFIGVAQDGATNRGNAGAGVRVEGAGTTTIGEVASSTSTTAANTIAFNTGAGVRVTDSTTTTIRRNSIFDNLSLGIDVGELGPDPTMVPVITLVQSGTTSTVVQGSVQAAALSTYTIDIYSNTTADPSGFGQGRTFLVAATVTTNASGFGTFSAQTSAPVAINAPVSATWTDPSGGTSEFAMDVDNTSPTIDLQISLTDMPDPVAAGGLLTYTIVVSNTSASTATNVVITDTMAAGLSFFGATFSPPGGSISQSGQVLTFRVGDLAPMSSVTVVMTTTAPTTAGSPANNAVVTATENDNNQGNNSAMVTTQVQLGVDLVVATTVAPPSNATVGSNLGFLISVTNTAPRNATNVILMTSVPAGTTFVAVTASTGSVTQNGDQIAVSIGTIAPTATVLVTLVVTPTIAGPVIQSATASSTELDIFPPNNTRETRVIVEPAITSQPTNNGPQILQAVRVRGAAHTARFRLTFNESLDATSAEDLRNYRLFIPGPDGRFGTGDDVRVGIRAAKYDPIARIVSLTTTRRLSAHATVEVRVDGVEPQALRDAGGVLLDGNGDGTPGGTYVARIRGFGAATVLRRNASRGRRG